MSCNIQTELPSSIDFMKPNNCLVMASNKIIPHKVVNKSTGSKQIVALSVSLCDVHSTDCVISPLTLGLGEPKLLTYDRLPRTDTTHLTLHHYLH